MQTIEKYTTNDAFIRLILQGPPGTGKTSAAVQFPGVYIADCDLNLGGPLRYLKSKNLPLPVGYDIIDRDENDKIIAEEFRYTRLVKCLQAACAEPSVKTIVIDSATKVSDYIIAHVLSQMKTKTGGMEMQSWGFYLAFWKDLINAISAQKKHLILICHEKVEKDEIDQSLRYFLNIPGQFGNIAGALFTDVWRAEVKETPGFPPKYEFLIRTMPNYRFNLKNSFQLPGTFPFAWKTIEDKLK